LGDTPRPVTPAHLHIDAHWNYNPSPMRRRFEYTIDVRAFYEYRFAYPWALLNIQE